MIVISKVIVRKMNEILAAAIFVPPYFKFSQGGTELLFPLSLKCSIPDNDYFGQAKNPEKSSNFG
jgi:hypothetical protein